MSVRSSSILGTQHGVRTDGIAPWIALRAASPLPPNANQAGDPRSKNRCPFTMGTKKPEERQRTVHACDHCKRRKQKCNGLYPCLSCSKRELECSYTLSERPVVHTLAIVGPKRDHANTTSDPSEGGRPSGMQGQVNDSNRAPMTIENGSGQNLATEQDEEVQLYGQARFVMDHSGRVSYVGESAAFSHLQLTRMVVENVVGESPFSQGRDQHQFFEPCHKAAVTRIDRRIIPGKGVAEVLVQSFFTNTLGMINLLDRRDIQTMLDDYYNGIPTVPERSCLCLLYMVLSIGLVLATPAPGTPEHAIIAALRARPIDCAESFFQRAKNLVVPLPGAKDDIFLSVMALCLMSVHTLATSNQNAAHAYLDMAIRSAYTLGLHQPSGTEDVFGDNEPRLMAQRRNVWRSLFMLDRFLATSMGRPLKISEEDCPEDSFKAPDVPMALNSNKMLSQERLLNAHGLESGVQAGRTIGRILKQVYSKPKISTKLAQDVAEECKSWAKDLHPILNAELLSDCETMTAHGVAILQVRLLGDHSIILLTRPFFMHLLIHVCLSKAPTAAQNSQIKQLSEACVVSSVHTIQLTRQVLKAGCLPRRNPFIIYFVFSATLVLLNNEFGCLHENVKCAGSILDAMHILSYCATNDFLARRYLCIMTEFLKVVQNRIRSCTQGSPPQTRRPAYAANASMASLHDPAESLPSSNRDSKGNSLTSSAPARPPLKPAISQISQAPMGTRTILPPATGGIVSRVPGIRSQYTSHGSEFRRLIEVSRRIRHGKGQGRPGLFPANLDARFGKPWKLPSGATKLSRAVTMTSVLKEPTIKVEDKEWQGD
ncbi:hypothetical protein B0T10DRAFT_584029 [Thelonectria olida]|uniref:Zn(2)-C6 fungal-type domain-containing protein n=1 Tax=Thelonectria olida TaxID=1576542 RepID=A0A9P8WF08_9HYPO|nr:hypothetical protein B0T10DRAFT_584029 [Thelonectria olida]